MYLFVTSKRGISAYDGRPIVTSTGKKIPTDRLSGVLSFYSSPVLDGLPVKRVFVSEEGTEFGGIDINPAGVDRHEIDMLSWEVFELGRRALGRTAKDFLIDSPQMLHALCLTNRLAYHTFTGFLALYTGVEPISLPVRELPLKLHELIFLPAVAYALSVELERVLLYLLPPCKGPRECVNLLLSYLFSSHKFDLLVRRCLNLALRQSTVKPHLSKAHGSFPAHPCKLSKSGKCVQPFQDPLLF